MPWKESSLVKQREEFVRLALAPGAKVVQLCDRYGISRKTAYKWIDVYQKAGVSGLVDRSRRPHHSPKRVSDEIEQAVLDVAYCYPAWGARKLHRIVSRDRRDVPSVSTIQAILKRHGRVCQGVPASHRAVGRFEHPKPNDLWQMDFKESILLYKGHADALTVLDDHSRFSLCLRACADQRTNTVQQALQEAFRCYGLPRRMTMDNGSPWGDDGASPYTRFTVWLLKLGIGVSHSRPYHPQTQGKDERFHRTLKAELLQQRIFDSPVHLQSEFDRWRHQYNTVRPHEGIGMQTPIERYAPSPMSYPERIPTVEYDTHDQVRKVCQKSLVSWNGHRIRVGKAFIGENVAVRTTQDESTVEIYFATHRIKIIDLKNLK